MSIEYNKRGFGLVEALISIFIFAILLLGLNYSLIIAMEYNIANFLRNSATKIAQGYADKLRSSDNITSTGLAVDCDPNDGSDKAIDYIPLRNTTVKFETVWSYNELPGTAQKIYNLTVTTCYYHKSLMKHTYETKIYKGKGGL
ncbi:MAG: prepilin-type N-terminal cleavage/methylation domain-containing protein [Deferribacterales bacterium]